MEYSHDLLREVLTVTMGAPAFNAFRLVGGTSLSLQLGHRLSVDIDLFTDASYGSIDFEIIDRFFRDHFNYVETYGTQIGIGTSYFIGSDEQHAVKADLYYTDEFIQSAIQQDGVRLATMEEIIAMKPDVVSRAGRKKDFWDLHAMIDDYSIDYMLQLYEKRYPYTHNRAIVLENMIDFREADNDFDPVCLQGKHWELIKYDISRWINH